MGKKKSHKEKKPSYKAFSHFQTFDLSDQNNENLPLNVPFTVRLDVVTIGNQVTLRLPALNFEFPPGTEGFVYTQAGFLPEKIRPYDLINQAFRLPSVREAVDVGGQGYDLYICIDGSIKIVNPGNVPIPTGPHGTQSTTVTYLTRSNVCLLDEANRRLLVCPPENVQITTFPSNLTIPTLAPGILSFQYAEFYDNAILGDKFAAIYNTNGSPTGFKNSIDVYIQTGIILTEQDHCHEKKKIQLTNLTKVISGNPGDSIAEGGVRINPTDPNNLAYIIRDALISGARIMHVGYSLNGGLTWNVSNITSLPGFSADPNILFDDFGNLWVIYHPTIDSIVTYTVSIDKGATFTFVVDDIPATNFAYDYPRMAFGSDGNNGKALWASYTAFPGFNTIFTFNLPTPINYPAGSAAFGATLEPPLTPFTKNLAFTTNLDGTPNNPGDFVGKIALVQRGIFNFTTKAGNAQAAGAVGCIIYNSLGRGVFSPGFVPIIPPVIIPVIGISQADGLAIVASLTSVPTTTGTMNAAGSAPNYFEAAYLPVTGLGAFGTLVSKRVNAGDNIQTDNGEITITPEGKVYIYVLSNLYESEFGTTRYLLTNPTGTVNYNENSFLGPKAVNNVNMGASRYKINYQSTRRILPYGYGIAYDPETHRLYLPQVDVWPDRSQDAVLYITYTDNDGASFSPPIQISDQQTNGRGSFNMSRDSINGNLFFSWYDARNDSTGAAVDTFLAVLSQDILRCLPTLPQPVQIVQHCNLQTMQIQNEGKRSRSHVVVNDIE